MLSLGEKVNESLSFLGSQRRVKPVVHRNNAVQDKKISAVIKKTRKHILG